jgi:hypothetical protein
MHRYLEDGYRSGGKAPAGAPAPDHSARPAVETLNPDELAARHACGHRPFGVEQAEILGGHWKAVWMNFSSFC